MYINVGPTKRDMHCVQECKEFCNAALHYTWHKSYVFDPLLCTVISMLFKTGISIRLELDFRKGEKVFFASVEAIDGVGFGQQSQVRIFCM